MKIGKNLRALSKSVQTWSNFFKGIRPKKDFHKFNLPPEVDYNKLNNWACHPSNQSKVSLRPQGVEVSKNQKQVDVFFIHPTSFFGNFNWNAPVDHVQSKELVDELIIPAQASVFNSIAEIYAPRYRQATFYSFLSGGANAKFALDLAYEDIKKAFEYYIEHYNGGRPFILAGHSQGSLLGLRLLEDYVDQTLLFQQFIAAYLPGYKIPSSKFEHKLKNIKKGLKEDDIQCVLAWDTFLDKPTSLSFIDNAITWYTDSSGKSYWRKRLGLKVFSCNPLSWTQDNIQKNQTDVAVINEFKRDRSLNWTDMSDEKQIGIKTIALRKPSPNAIYARLKKDGLLYIKKPIDKMFGIGLMPGGNYHVHDYNLFYMSIRANLEKRCEVFFKMFS